VWRPFKDTCYTHFGVLDFGLYTSGNSLHAPENVTIYVKTEIDVPESKEYLLKTQSDDQMVLWIDGQEVCRINSIAPVTRAVRRRVVHLAQGRHRVRMRVNQWHHTSFGDGPWQASLRFRTAEDDVSAIIGVQ
jgi:hypothetical protein